MTPIAIIDVETTGLNPLIHEIIEIGCVVPGKEPFSVKVMPVNLTVMEAEALEVNGFSEEEWQDAYTLKRALELLTEYVPTGSYLMAYNATFDWSFLQAAYHKTGVAVPFHYHRLDLLTLAWAKLPKGAKLSLSTVCVALGIEAEPVVHRALGGAKCAYQIYQKLYETL